MPQKRNPDAAELTRAKTGRIVGDLTGLLIVMKGLPLAYSKDMQEDKERVFDAFESLSLAIAATAGMVRDMEPDAAAMRKAAGASYATATDLADWLVRALGLPFRKAHEVTGRIVALAEEKGLPLHKLALADMQAVEPRITDEVYAVLGVAQSVKSRTSFGGTAPQNVRREARRWLARLARETTRWTDADRGEIAIMATRPGVGRDMRSGALARLNSPILVRIVVAGMVVATGLTLTACGRKGPLEPPPSAKAVKDPGPQPDQTKPDRHFFLDPLVK